MPLPATELVPETCEPAAAIPAIAVGVDDDRAVAPETAPANGTVVVVVEGAVIGATARGVGELSTVVVESVVWVFVLLLEVIGEVVPICPV
jgi:hypothetical protein